MDLLHESERRFTKKLCDAMIPHMVETFWEIWLEAKKQSQGKATPQVFDELLREIKSWNSSISLKHTEAIIKADPLFPKLLAAVFVTHVKILSAIRTDKKSKKICIKLPANDVFVQRCYEACAEDIYKRPDVIINPSINEDTRMEQLNDRFCVKIHKVIDSLIPTADILDAYLPMGGNLNLDGDDEENADLMNEDPVEESMNEPEAEPEPESMNDNAAVDGVPMNTNDEAPAGTPGGLEMGATPGGTKTVAVTPSLQPPRIPEQNLFDDAREK
jgi:hypothetical protein